MPNKSHEELEKELAAAKGQVKIGGIYVHYKNPDAFYKVIGLGIQEATDTVCVIYQAEYNKELIFVRDLVDWMKKPSENKERFMLVKK